jgi:hypothetical protein
MAIGGHDAACRGTASSRPLLMYVVIGGTLTYTSARRALGKWRHKLAAFHGETRTEHANEKGSRRPLDPATTRRCRARRPAMTSERGRESLRSLHNIALRAPTVPRQQQRKQSEAIDIARYVDLLLSTKFSSEIVQGFAFQRVGAQVSGAVRLRHSRSD